MQEQVFPDKKAIQDAYRLIKPYIHQTPVLTSELLNRQLGCSIYLKCENFQKAGAFKYRGATNAILNLTAEQKTHGVTTHSSGNHAGALAKAAALQGITSYIIMPKNAPQVKIDAVKSYGGIITFCEPTLEAREQTVEKVQKQTGAILVHPYNNYHVICGQGTACLELTSQMKEPDFVIAPVGGGGLLSGTAISAKSWWNKTKVIGAEPFNANDAWQSFNQKRLIPSQNPNTIADGLKTSLAPITFTLITQLVDDILTVREETIVEAMRLVYQFLKIIIEPSSAVPVASILENPGYFKGKQVAVIISGGNVDLARLPF